jgi:hypothetical protein
VVHGESLFGADEAHALNRWDVSEKGAALWSQYMNVAADESGRCIEGQCSKAESAIAFDALPAGNWILAGRLALKERGGVQSPTEAAGVRLVLAADTALVLELLRQDDATTKAMLRLEQRPSDGEPWQPANLPERAPLTIVTGNERKLQFQVAVRPDELQITWGAPSDASTWRVARLPNDRPPARLQVFVRKGRAAFCEFEIAQPGR